MKIKAIPSLFKDTFADWSEDKAARLGAALAYYTIFSIGPLLVIIIAIASLLFQDAQDQLVGTIRNVVGEESAKVISQTIENANKGNGSIIATVLGIVTLLFGASGVFGQLKDALNTIWEVQPKPGQGLIATIRQRFFSFTMVLGTGFLLMASLTVSAAVSALGTFFSSILPGSELLWQIVNLLLSVVVMTIMFALLFKFLPDIKIGWKDVWIGAVVTAILFTAGQAALSLYIASGMVGSAFGAAGSLVIVLVWIYYSAQILFLGAEFTQVYTNKYGSRMQPAKNAEPLTEDARAQQGMLRKDNEKGEKDGRKSGEDKAKEARTKGSLWKSPWFS